MVTRQHFVFYPNMILSFQFFFSFSLFPPKIRNKSTWIKEKDEHILLKRGHFKLDLHRWFTLSTVCHIFQTKIKYHDRTTFCFLSHQDSFFSLFHFFSFSLSPPKIRNKSTKVKEKLTKLKSDFAISRSRLHCHFEIKIVGRPIWTRECSALYGQQCQTIDLRRETLLTSSNCSSVFFHQITELDSEFALQQCQSIIWLDCDLMRLFGYLVTGIHYACGPNNKVFAMWLLARLISHIK